MLTVHHLYKTYGAQQILRDISFNIGSGQHIGLIGPNGCGKTTLMRILAGIESPDSGTVSTTHPNLRIGYLAQGLSLQEGETLQSALNLTTDSPQKLEAEVSALASALSTDPNNLALQVKYESTINQLSAAAYQPRAILAPLGLADIPPDTSLQHLSGGQKTRLMLARILIYGPQLLLLDEPTNHLDIEMLEWLESWMSAFPGGALIVSHDRAFLDHCVQSVLDFNPDTHNLRTYTGGYIDYLAQRLREQEKQRAMYQDQQGELRRLKRDVARTKEQARHVEITTTPRQPSVRRIAKKVAAKAKAREKKLERYLQSDERVDKPKPSWQMKLEFASPDNLSKNVLLTENLSVGYTCGQPILKDLNLQVRAGQRIALTGVNGAGKTTLLRTVAGMLQPLAGSLKLGASVKLGYMAQEQELLDPDLSALQMLAGAAPFNETEARNFLHYFLFEDDDPLRPSHELSFGERARLQLALLVAQGCSFLLLDEPINHLDIPSRTRFEQALKGFQGTALAVVHDRYFIERFATNLWTVKDGKVHTMNTQTVQMHT